MKESASDRSPRPRRGRALVGTLVATAALLGGAQAALPAIASAAMAEEDVECTAWELFFNECTRNSEDGGGEDSQTPSSSDDGGEGQDEEATAGPGEWADDGEEPLIHLASVDDYQGNLPYEPCSEIEAALSKAGEALQAMAFADAATGVQDSAGTVGAAAEVNRLGAALATLCGVQGQAGIGGGGGSARPTASPRGAKKAKKRNPKRKRVVRT